MKSERAFLTWFELWEKEQKTVNVKEKRDKREREREVRREIHKHNTKRAGYYTKAQHTTKRK